jgi:predicted nucleic acid-binding protein
VTEIAVDSGPLIVFARAGLLGVARQVAGSLLVPGIVAHECCGDLAKPGANAIITAREAGQIEIQPQPETKPQSLLAANLDAGEMAVIQLATTRNCAVLMDERLGRAVAIRNGARTIGSAGILIAAKRRGLVDEIAPILKLWQGWGFFLSPSLLARVLMLADEQ